MIRPLALCLGLAACAPAPELPGEVAPDADLREIRRDEAGLCYGRTTTPAVIETVTEQVRETPAVLGPDGEEITPATFRTVTRQRILRERRAAEFEAICPEDLTPELVASLGRALSARGLYDGPPPGAYDARLAAAVERFQSDGGGPQSSVLARASAVELGLVALRPEELERL
ncbi:peptidoglycan-binding domain-containing protein [Histidinibacterium aquaticum]|uniref:peptidoglycan-binding domain-containing protein n=1 Tax=Histidinibacterium aquaticum TaxID=2613962 RepID=UPI001CC7E139|nr:peptidoglycan-binding domain-containing protein [Histidinibacterium aquaticum]